MAVRSVFAKTLYDRRHGLVWWTVGIAALAVATMSVWPSVRDEYAQLVKNYPEPLLALFGIDKGGLSTAAGYLQAELFSLMIPLAFVAYMIAGSSASIAGEQEAGTLEFLLALPVSRRRVVAQKFLGLCVSLLVIAAGLAAALVASARLFGLSIGVVDLLAATISAYLLATLFGALALLIGCMSGHRALAAGVVAGCAGGAYLLTSLAGLVDGLKRFRPVSPFWWYSGNEPLRHGLDPLHVGLLAVVAMLLFAGALAVFDRRDVT